MILFIVLLLSAAVRLRALQLVSEPEGLSKLWRNVKDYFYVWPFAYRCGEGR
ncbi:hypothetical protein [Candidatus Palauibacter sp.]|uniref:hypothetical protein n=1 Tax=Candidatus Palauibacter sp. TaxID=3101350 RepID=UPI003B5203F9